MKTLSLLLLLTLGLGAAWWQQSYPGGGTLEDVRREADTLVTRAGTALGHAREGAIDALGLAIGRPDAGDANVVPALDAEEAGAADAPTAATEIADVDGATDTAPITADVAASDADAVDALATTLAPTLAATEALAVRLEALEANLAEAGESERSDGEAEALRERLDETERRLDATAEREARILDRLSVIDERIVTLADRLDALGTASRTGTSAGPTADLAIGDGSEDADGTPDGAAGDDVVDGIPVAGRDTFADDARQADPIAGRLDTLAAGLDRRLARLEARADDTPTDAARLDELAARVDALAAAADDAGPTDADPARAAPLAGGDDSVDAMQAAIRSELAEIDEQVGEGAASEDAPALGEALESTRKRLATLEDRVQAMPATSAAADVAKGTQDALQEQVRELERRLEALSRTDPEIVDSISAVREQVDELANRGFVTQDELRAQTEGENVEYKIYFDPNRTDISEDAARVLDSFIVQERNRTTGVSIFGFTDRRGSASYNQRLALERATNVRSYLIRNGLPYTKIRALSGLGEDAAAAILPDDADDAQQRVVVLFAAQP